MDNPYQPGKAKKASLLYGTEMKEKRQRILKERGSETPEGVHERREENQRAEMKEGVVIKRSQR